MTKLTYKIENIDGAYNVILLNANEVVTDFGPYETKAEAIAGANSDSNERQDCDAPIYQIELNKAYGYIPAGSDESRKTITFTMITAEGIAHAICSHWDESWIVTFDVVTGLGSGDFLGARLIELPEGNITIGTRVRSFDFVKTFKTTDFTSWIVGQVVGFRVATDGTLRYIVLTEYGYRNGERTELVNSFYYPHVNAAEGDDEVLNGVERLGGTVIRESDDGSSYVAVKVYDYREVSEDVIREDFEDFDAHGSNSPYDCSGVWCCDRVRILRRGSRTVVRQCRYMDI